MKMQFQELERISSDVLATEYIVGKVGNQFVYVWTDQLEIDSEFPDGLLSDPECMNGALVGTKEEIVWELENCVGSFRDHGNEDQKEAAAEVVETLEAALEGE